MIFKKYWGQGGPWIRWCIPGAVDTDALCSVGFARMACGLLGAAGRELAALLNLNFPDQEPKLDIWPQGPRYFVASIAMHCVMGGGWHIPGRGLTVVLTWLMTGRGVASVCLCVGGG